MGGTNFTASTFDSIDLYIPNYTSSNNKSFSVDSVAENNSATVNQLDLIAGLWSQTAAITSITFTSYNAANFVANSTFSLYGLAALGTTPAIAPKASGGNIIDYDGTYWIHTFNTNGTFTPQTGLTCDYLVVAGGGGGGVDSRGAGGGAGGYRTSAGTSGANSSAESALSLTSGTAIVQVAHTVLAQVQMQKVHQVQIVYSPQSHLPQVAAAVVVELESQALLTVEQVVQAAAVVVMTQERVEAELLIKA